MHVSKRTAIALLVTAALAGSAASAVSALGRHGGNHRVNHGKHHGNTVLNATLAPSMPTDPMIHGVAAGNVPWVLRRGEVRLRRDGRIRLVIRGLVVPPPTGNGTPGAVMTVNASLYCGADTTAADTTASVALSRSGNARIDDTLSLPSKCLAPVALVHPNGNLTRYIAASGFGG